MAFSLLYDLCKTGEEPMSLFHYILSLFDGKNTGKILEFVFISSLVVIVIYLIGSGL